MDELLEARKAGKIPRSVEVEYKPQLVHDFVVRPSMVREVLEYCLRCIERVSTGDTALSTIKSRL